ncbi:MAG TPA: Wadjet anti-phage system protein JetA family protein, partial [Luteolibacter sp.]
AERPWQTVENCLSNVREGLIELRSMQKSVQRFTRRQLEEETLRGNLAVVFDDYSDQMSRSCYAALVRARLPTRLPDAVRRIAERLADDPATLADMQTEVLRRHPELSAESARAKVAAALEELIERLERVLPMADEIDRRTADFTRRSLARFRYLQDVTGERRTELKAFFEIANRSLAGRRLQRSNPTLPELPDLLLPAVKLPAGLDSLYSPPNRRPPLEQDAFDDAVSESDRESGLHDMQRTIRESLTVARANRFIQSLPGGKGERIESDRLDLNGDHSSADLIALLLHAEAPDARYRLDVHRVADESTPPSLDTLHDIRVERFAIIKK